MGGIIDPTGFVARDGTRVMTADWNMGDVNIGIGVVPAKRFEIGSTDLSDRISIYHDNTNGYIDVDDGGVYIRTVETNQTLRLYLQGNGTGDAAIQIYADGASANYFRMEMSTGSMLFDTYADKNLDIHTYSGSNVRLWPLANDGDTFSLQLSGFRAADARRTLSISVGASVADQVDFTGLSKYYFDDAVGIGVTPAQKFEIGSTDNSNRISIYHDNTNGFISQDDGAIIFLNTEVDTDNVVSIKGNGTGEGWIELYDADNLEW